MITTKYSFSCWLSPFMFISQKLFSWSRWHNIDIDVQVCLKKKFSAVWERQLSGSELVVCHMYGACRSMHGVALIEQGFPLYGASLKGLRVMWPQDAAELTYIQRCLQLHWQYQTRKHRKRHIFMESTVFLVNLKHTRVILFCMCVGKFGDIVLCHYDHNRQTYMCSYCSGLLEYCCIGS